MEKQVGTLSATMMNPMIKRLYRSDEQAEGKAATYGGITAKTLFFLVMLVLGGGLYFVLRPYLATGEPMVIENYEYLKIYTPEAAVVIGALLLSAVSPFLAFLIKPLVPVLGTLYCLSIGYTFTWTATVLSNEVGGTIYAAAIITAILVLAMTLLYATGLVKVDSKFRGIVTTLFFTCALSGLVGFVFSFIPGLRDLVALFTGNPILSIVMSVLYIIIACAFLLVDFEAIHHTVEAEKPKKYEWIAAFGLVYTVVYLFFKILNLLAKLGEKKNA